LGRDHMRDLTRHEIVEHKAIEIRRAEEHNNFARRTEDHRDLARTTERAPAPRPVENRRLSETRGGD
jgi:hypothetical protein